MDIKKLKIVTIDRSVYLGEPVVLEDGRVCIKNAGSACAHDYVKDVEMGRTVDIRTGTAAVFTERDLTEEEALDLAREFEDMKVAKARVMPTLNCRFFDDRSYNG